MGKPHNYIFQIMTIVITMFKKISYEIAILKYSISFEKHYPFFTYSFNFYLP